MALFFHSGEVDQLIPFKDAVQITEEALRIPENVEAYHSRHSSMSVPIYILARNQSMKYPNRFSDVLNFV